ncbi:hypothetical protein PT974_03518 [Cladobotryum mycophilum]|uniref:Transcription factor domain-containing protein n=1 Tax=Cladobotryum mycophilum TaxID=491253 RepID=A0ABR0SSJ7_9HYPO
MGDPLDQERPAKRLKIAPQQQSGLGYQHAFIPPTTNMIAPSAGDPWAAGVTTTTTTTTAVPGTQFGVPWPPSQMLIALEPTPDGAHGGGAWAPVPGLILTPVPVPVLPMSTPFGPAPSVSTPTTIDAVPSSSAPLPPDFDLPPTNHAAPMNPRHDQTPPSQQSLSASDTVVEVVPSSLRVRDQRIIKRSSKRKAPKFESPFTECIDSFGKLTSPRFPRPSDGKVNGYIKFHWPERKAPLPQGSSVAVIEECDDDDEDDETPQSSQSYSMTRNNSNALILAHGSPGSVTSTMGVIRSPIEGDFRSVITFTHSSPSSQPSPSFSFAYSPQDILSFGGSSPTAPRMVPPQFGMLAKMDHMDRQFWSFYIQNWCPGRSVLGKTNLWLKDFAKMHESAGVRAAIQSLAGIYIYDYQPMDAIRTRTNQRFALAERRLRNLLSDPENITEDEASELITIASILSMQDIVLTERRRQKPLNPRWLIGYRQSEYFLEATDQGSRFWRKSNVQLSSLRISQSIIVGRAVVLAQPMMPLPHPESFDPEEEASRFGWLLYGTDQDMFEIHGGCGFSKRLLHIMSQITYCAARLQQDSESTMVPVTAKFLLGELQDMRQWSSESNGWDEAKGNPQTVEWVRGVPEGFVIDSSSHMTNVTAEAWRLAAMIYLQCRALRLPRTCQAVVNNMTDLAKCIRIMPTSGTHFTAQAPLFPVFLLGLLAANEDHRRVSETWFSLVVSTPVRSSVPPLYDALQRVWCWIDNEPKITPPADCTIPDAIRERHPWWEDLVRLVQVGEPEVLCLT